MRHVTSFAPITAASAPTSLEAMAHVKAQKCNVACCRSTHRKGSELTALVAIKRTVENETTGLAVERSGSREVGNPPYSVGQCAGASRASQTTRKQFGKAHNGCLRRCNSLAWEVHDGGLFGLMAGTAS